MKLGRHFTLAELSHSGTAVRFAMRNEPGPREIQALSLLCRNALDPLRDHLQRPIIITSGYRSPAVNRRVGGSPTSQHMLGEAVDFIVPGMTPDQIVRAIRHIRLPYDQVIEEFGQWVHLSYRPGGRRQALLARKVNGRTQYTPFR